MTDHEHESAVWSDKDWSEWAEYADEVRVEVRFKTWLGAEEEPEYWVLVADGAEWSKDWLTRQLVQLAAADAGNSCCGRGNYALDVVDRKTEWGASGAAVEAILTLSQDLLSEVTWVALGALAQQLASRLRTRYPDELPMTEEQARDSAIWAVLMRSKDTEHESLEVRSLEIKDERTVLVEVKDRATGMRYTVEVTGHSGSVRLSRVRKITQPGREE